MPVKVSSSTPCAARHLLIRCQSAKYTSKRSLSNRRYCEIRPIDFAPVATHMPGEEELHVLAAFLQGFQSSRSGKDLAKRELRFAGGSRHGHFLSSEVV